MSQRQPAEPRQANSAQTKSLDATARQLNLDAPAPSIASSPSPSISQATIQRALANPRALAPNDILQLQRTIGNHAVQRMLQQESQDGFEASSDFEGQLNRTQGSGSPLPKKTKHEFEQSFGADLSNVRIHTNSASNQLNRSIQAQAFTHGNNIHFGAGEFKPATAEGKHLLAHELTHTIQQTGGKPANRVQAKLQVGAANDRYEQEADRVAQSVSSGSGDMVSNVQRTSVPSVQRMMKFKPEDLQGDLSKKAKRSGKLGITSTYRKLQIILEKYWTSHGDPSKQMKLLIGIRKLSAKWLKEHMSSYHKSNTNDRSKYTSVARLSTEVNREIAKLREKMESQEFLRKFDKGSSHLENVPLKVLIEDPLAPGKQVSYNRRHNVPHKEWGGIMDLSNGYGGTKKIQVPFDSEDPEKSRQQGEQYEQEQYDKYRALKKYGLTPGQRAALRAYTSEQYLYINPALDNNVDWMKGAVEQYYSNHKKQHEDTAFIKKAMDTNREFGSMVNSAINKLPAWEQTQTLYRGESITDGEANRMNEGFVKHYGHLVSTSLKLDTPRSQMGKFKNDKRPWGIIYHITDSKTGRDIDELSHAKGELEILFPSDTDFQVTKVLEKDTVKKHIEVEVKQI